MNWTFHPTNEELRTTLPMSIEVTDYVGKPKINVSEIGQLELKRTGTGSMKADFYVTLPGKYVIEIRDQESAVVHEIHVKQQVYLDFKNEFGFFFVLFLLVMGGIVLWTRKIMKNKTV